MVPLTHYLLFSGLLFSIGLAGVIIRRNVIVILMCLEMMLTAANITLIAFARAQGTLGLPHYDGEIMVLFIMAIAAAEVAIGLALIVSLYKGRNTVNAEDLTVLKD